LLGRPLSGTSAADAGLLMSAATGAGLSQGEEVAQAIGSRLGLEEVRIASDGGLETTALVLGRYLAPRIYVRYLAGLAGAGQRVQLSYEITDRLEWQVESGEHTGTDLFYTIERKPRADGDREE
jgi:translocation and assembly module TamB